MSKSCFLLGIEAHAKTRNGESTGRVRIPLSVTPTIKLSVTSVMSSVATPLNLR